MAKSARSKACDIKPSVRQKVKERDDNMCIWCGRWIAAPQLCHYIGRNAGGLGIEQNLVCGCAECHRIADQGTQSQLYKHRMRAYLMEQYPDWNEDELRYKKGYDG